jgi:RHS repeat-associated protein
MGRVERRSPAGGGLRGLRHCMLLVAAGASMLVPLAPGMHAAAQPLAPNPLFAKAVWVGVSEGALKLLAADGSLLLEVSGLKQVQAVAIDDQRTTLWVAAGNTLLSYGFDGTAELAIPLPHGGGGRALLAVNTMDGSLWLARDETLRGFSAAGQALQVVQLHNNVVGLSIDPGEGLLWVATSNSVGAYDAVAGQLVRTLALGRDADVRDVSADAATKSVWVARQGGLLHFGADGTLLLTAALRQPVRVSAGPNGDVWAATKRDLMHLSGAGQVLGNADPFTREGEISQLVTDPVDGSAWAASEHEVAHASAAGQLLRLVNFDPPAEIRGLAMYADLTPPQIRIVAPGPGSYVNSQTPTLQVSYSDIGSGVDASSLAFAVSSTALPVSCTYGAAGASCTPGTPLPGGPISLTATVKDFAGNTAQPAAVTFTIDTIPPVVTIASPAAGLLTNQPRQTVAGAVSKPATVTVDGAAAAVTPGLTFALPITLLEGPNTIVVVATDLAGNQGAASVQVTLDTIPPAAIDPQKVTVTAPAGGSSTVSAGPGSAEPAATVLLTDTDAESTAATVVAADGSFTTTIACRSGDQIQIVLRDGAGNSSTPTTVTVPGSTGGGPPPDPSTVATPIDPTVVTDIAASTAFLFTGHNPIQQGARPGAIDPNLVAVLRGSVHDRAGQPIAGVAITVVGRPDLGGTQSRADGMFDLAANGGGLITVELDKAGFLPAQRQVRAPWRDYAWLPDVVLVPADGAATVIDTTRAVLQVARSSAVQDRDGSRQATMLFPAGTTAQVVLPGGQASPLPTLTVRATEYTVGPTGPQAMPAPLPPSSAYTYAVELGADEAAGSGASVKFSQPVPFYLENFLGFPVGGVVPAGYYDRGNAQWVASDNGLVVKVLSVTAGAADLDLTGAGLPADAASLAALGITADERQSLAALYPVGQTLWRVPLRHFSTLDFNWPYHVPADSVAPPNQDGGPPSDLSDPCDQAGASTISCENQALGEDVPIIGTPFTLHYHSDRVPGRLGPRSVQIVLSGPNPPASLVRIDLEVAIAGRRFQQSFAPGPNLASTFTWDGIDGYGRQLQGEQLLTVTTSYIIDGEYAPPPAGTPAWGNTSPDLTVDLLPTRFEISVARSFTTRLGSIDVTSEKLGGWTLSAHHEYDPSTRTVWLGDGARENADPIGTNAAQQLAAPSSLPLVSWWLAADGSFDIADRGFGGYGNIYRVDRNGNSQLEYDNVGESVPIWGVARDKFNQLFFASCDPSSNHAQIRTVLVPGTLTSVVVIDTAGGCGSLLDFLPDNAGGFYLVNSSVYHLSPDGTFTTVVDSSTIPLFGATNAALAPDGSLFIADRPGGRIFRRDPSGNLTVVAGTGSPGSAGDGGPAILAQLQGPLGIAVAPDGTLWLDDGGTLRRIDRAGFIITVPGVSLLGRPSLDPNGVVYFLDGQGISRLGDPFPGFSTNAFLVAAEDASEVYQFSAQGRHLSTVDPVTGVVLYSFTYDGSNLLTGVQDRDGRVTRIERDAQGKATGIVSPDGQRTTLAMGTDGYLQRASNPAGEAVSFTYQHGGLMATQTDPRGFQSTYQYSGDGRLVSDADAAGGFKHLLRAAGLGFDSVTMTTGVGDTFQYGVQYPTGGGRLRLFTGPDGLTTRYATAPNGQRTVTWPDGSIVTTILGPDPRFGLQSPIVTSEQTQMPSGLTRTTSASRVALLGTPGDPLSLSTLIDSWTMNGRVATETFDRSQMQWSFQAPTGRMATATLNAAGRPTSVQVGNLEPVQLIYDGAGRITSAIQGTGTAQRVMNFSYGADGRLGSFTDPLNRTFSFTWDAAGNLVSRTLPDGRSLSFTYDADRNLISVTPPTRPPRAFTFTPVDLQQSYTPPDLGSGPTTTIYGYDLDRRLTAINRPDGSTITLTYKQGTLASINSPQGPISFSYYPTSSLVQAVSSPSGETVTYTYDGDLLTKTTWSGPVQGTLDRSSNQDFQLSSQSVNGQPPVGFQYDGDGLVIQAGDLSLSRDPVTGLATGTSLGLVTTSQAYNSFGELSSLGAAYAGSEIFRTDLTRDIGGRIARRVETISGTASSYDYSYDGAGRLTDVAKDGAPLSHYGYDSNSNRSTTVERSTTITSSFDAQDRLVSNGARSYAYSANGDLVSKSQPGGTVTLTYDSLGSLVTFIDASGVRSDYIIDGEDRRVGKKVNGVLVQAFLWQDRGKVVAELDGSGNIVSTFVYATQVNVPDYMINQGTTYRLLTDHLGSPRLVVDISTGVVAQQLDYDAWGGVILDTNPGFQPFGFAGGIYDYRTGLVRFGARDYDPEVGRWTAHEPVLLSGSNLYEYASDDPVNLYDPEGWAPKAPPPPGGYPPILGPLGPNGQPKGVPPELGPWKWSPDPHNDRGGKWYRPGKGNGGKFCSWQGDSGYHGAPHWDVDDGKGHRERYDENGNRLPDDPPKLPSWPTVPPGLTLFPIIEPCLIMPYFPGCPSAGDTGPISG